MPLTPAHLEAFTAAGDGRFVFAAWRDAPERELFYLEDGRGSEVRQLAKEQLRCFVEGCESPALTTVASARRRDHFRHLKAPSGGHSPESIGHLQGKALLARWLSRVPGGRVEVERAADTQRRSIPDVLFTHAEGWRVAFEVQFAAISVAAWRERHRRYEEADIHDVWLFGAPGRNLLHTRGVRKPPIALTDTQREIASAGGLVWWIHPELGELGLAVESAQVGGTNVWMPATRYAELDVGPLEAFTISHRGVDGPLVEQMRQTYRAFHTEHDERIAREREEAEANAAADLLRRQGIAIRAVALGEEPDRALVDALTRWFRLRRLGEPTAEQHEQCKDLRAEQRRLAAAATREQAIRSLLADAIDRGEFDGVANSSARADELVRAAALGQLDTRHALLVKDKLWARGRALREKSVAGSRTEREARVWRVVEACWHPHEGEFRRAVRSLHNEAGLGSPSWERLALARERLIAAGRLPESGVATPPDDAQSFRPSECLGCGGALGEELSQAGKWVHPHC